MDRLQVPGAHCSPRQGEAKDVSEARAAARFSLINFPVLCFFKQSLKKELDSLLEEKIRSPAPVDWQNRQSKDCAVITAIIDLITTQEKPIGSAKSNSKAWAPRGQHIYFNEDDDDDD